MCSRISSRVGRIRRSNWRPTTPWCATGCTARSNAASERSRLFTGIIEAVGTLVALEPRGSVVGVVIEAPKVAPGVRIGDSVAVNGACLTVTNIDAAAGRLAFDAVRETLDRTAVGALRVGARVNVERAMRADGRLDGHIVQGHVDGTGRVAALDRDGGDVGFPVEGPPEVAGHLV